MNCSFKGIKHMDISVAAVLTPCVVFRPPSPCPPSASRPESCSFFNSEVPRFPAGSLRTCCSASDITNELYLHRTVLTYGAAQSKTADKMSLILVFSPPSSCLFVGGASPAHLLLISLPFFSFLLPVSPPAPRSFISLASAQF